MKHEKIEKLDLINFAVEGLENEIKERLQICFDDDFLNNLSFIQNTLDLLISYNNILHYCTYEYDYTSNTFGISIDIIKSLKKTVDFMIEKCEG